MTLLAIVNAFSTSLLVNLNNYSRSYHSVGIYLTLFVHFFHVDRALRIYHSFLRQKLKINETQAMLLGNFSSHSGMYAFVILQLIRPEPDFYAAFLAPHPGGT